jgi:hypothetical protein
MKITILVLLLVMAGELCFSVFAQSGVIKELVGTVELKPAGATDFVSATAGAQVMQDTIVSTGFKSQAKLEVGSATILVRPLTRLTVIEITAMQGVEMVNLNLHAGRLRVDVKPPAGAKASFTVVSPIATASVRGTSFFFDTRNVSVREGTVAFKGSAGYGVQVPAGSFTGVSAYSVAAVAQDTASAAVTVSSPVGVNEATTGTAAGTGTGTSPSAPSRPSSGDFGIKVEF